MKVPPSEPKVLTSTLPKRIENLPQVLSTTARSLGISPIKLAADILRRQMGRQKLPYKDYFGFGLYRPELTEAERFEFVGNRECLALSLALRGDPDRSLSGLMTDKVLCELVLRATDLPTAETLAVARATPARLPYPVLSGAHQIAAFLAAEGRLPVFGKPAHGSRSLGAASFVGREGDTLVLGDGTRANLAALANEIARDYPDGYIFQSLLRPHPTLARLCGPVVGTLRVVTLRGERGYEPLYAVLKLPGPGSMVDGRASGRNGMALIDLDTGRIVRAQTAAVPAGTDQNESLVTGEVLPGAQLPDWEKAITLAKDVHALIGSSGIVGSDVILSDKGPVITELNINPLASLYQRASGRGLLNPDFKARFRESLQVQRAALPIKGLRI